MEAIRSFFSYFVTQAPYDTFFVRLGMWGAAVLLLIGIVGPVVLIWRRAWSNAFLPYSKWFGGARMFGLVFLFLFFLRYEGIRPFTLRVWVYVVAITFVVWAARNLKDWKRLAPVAQYKNERYERYEKYLPR